MKNVKKLTFSLTLLVMLLALGLIYAVPSVFADGATGKTHIDIDVKISAAESMIDVDARGDGNDIQIATGRNRTTRTITAGTAITIALLVEFSQIVTLDKPDEGITGPDVVAPQSGGNFGADDIFVRAFDKEGRSLGEISLDAVSTDATVISQFRDASKPGQQFLIRIDEDELTAAFVALRGGTLEIYSVAFYIPVGIPTVASPGLEEDPDLTVKRGIRKASLDHVVSHFDPDGPGDGKPHQHLNKQSNLFRVDLVDDDEGEAKYSTTLTATPLSGEGVPGIVTIDQLSERAGFIETGPFQVRVILTEEPKGGLTTDLILVEGGGKATAVVKGATLKGATEAGGNPPNQASELTLAMASFVPMAATIPTTTAGDLPEATGRDNEYHQYFVTITPDAGTNGYLTVSVKQFMDNVLPIANQYIPLTPEQRVGVTTGVATPARNARVANETIRVMVNSAGDAKIAAATAAYEVRSKDPTGIFNQNPNLKAIGKGLVIPANGYLVLAAGKTDSDPVSGVVNVDAKIAKKLTAAQKLYNVVYDFKLPFPANDLSNFFRNGGTLNLVHADIPEATGSGHGDSKASKDGDTTHKDYTGYVGATSTAIAAGDVIISEIMWGLDANSVNSQYIELHNTTATDIGIDHLEWAISVGSAPAPFTAIDTVSNNPPPVAPATSGYWPVPGSDGVSEIQPSDGFFTLVDIVSMSRVTGGTDGTAAASWAASMRPSANLGGRRIGTPGASNIYVKPAAPPPPAPTPTAAVATGADIMITEIMVDSDNGRLPQWIELTNVSMKEVSLAGWQLSITNDSADADAVGSSIMLDLSDQTLGVSTDPRNMGKGHSLLIIGWQHRGSPNLANVAMINAAAALQESGRPKLLSEMAFKVALVPPQTSANIVYGDMAGNLGAAEPWDIPTADGARSSLIRHEIDAAGMTTMGTMINGWVLASNTVLTVGQITWYGSDEDSGTPGQDAGGPLPVELSKFSAARDRVTGQVVITWETQSELNNAGFFIKRSQQRKGQFVVVNPTMIPGAGTTSEKQSYTYTDTTAKPNIVYYYQIEDVSLDGNRQTLTRGHRLKGHIGAAGKATTTWGELKTSHTQ